MNLDFGRPHVFLEGPAATGKTTQTIQRLYQLLADDVNPQSILLLVPQRTLGRVYQVALSQPAWAYASNLDIVTIGGLAKRSIALFWTEVAPLAGFDLSRGEPTFLTIETAQYYMSRFVDEALQQGVFDSIGLPRARLIAQTLDNLAKAAVNAFSLAEVVQRLSLAWGGHSSRQQVYEAWLAVALKFREYCRQENLLDFGLQIEVFTQHVATLPMYDQYIQHRYTHLIADNIEEMQPIALDFIRWLYPNLQSSWLVYDTEAGFRIFLGAEPIDAYALRTLTTTQFALTQSVVQTPSMQYLTQAVTEILRVDDDGDLEEVIPQEAIHDLGEALVYQLSTFYPQMLRWVCEQVIALVRSGVEPRQIVVLAPYLNDSLRFTIYNELEHAQIPIVSHRPSRSLREEPAARAILTLMQWINPAEPQLPPSLDMVDAFVHLIADLDPIRARLLVDIVYGPSGRRELGSFDEINAQMQKRITYTVGERYEHLRQWLLIEQEKLDETPPDYFIRRLFADIGSQPGYGFHNHLETGTIVSQLVESAYNFRQTRVTEDLPHYAEVWREYRQLVSEGLLAALHVESWYKEETNAVFIAPAYTYLMRNRVVDYQFWLDVGSASWAERLDQPLTHPYVLRRQYPAGQLWDDEQEVKAQHAMLRRLMLGLLRRCRQRIYLAIADLGEQGFEQRGMLLRIFQQVLQQYGKRDDDLSYGE